MQLGKTSDYSNNRTSFALDYSRNNFSEVANVFAALSSSQSNKSSRAIGNETVYIPLRKHLGSADCNQVIGNHVSEFTFRYSLNNTRVSIPSKSHIFLPS